MQEKIRISVVSYLNSKPFVHGLLSGLLDGRAVIELDIPSVCSEKLIAGQTDIGLVPVATLARMSHYHIISDYCIGADGEVSSVLLLSEVPMNEIEEILLDYQSRTSVNLARVLAKIFWKISPAWKDTSSDYEKKISGKTAGVVIGDRALLLKDKFQYAYDLSAEWKKFTGLPFVFACWVASKEIPADFIRVFNEALKTGLENISPVSINEANDLFSAQVIEEYLTKYIDFSFDEKKKIALKKFLDLIEK